MLAAVGAVLGLLPANSRAASLDRYGALPDVEEMQLSPSGALDAYIHRIDDERYVVIQDLNTGRIRKTLGIGKVLVRGLEWAGESHLLILTSTVSAAKGIEGGVHDFPMATDYDLATDTTYSLLSQEFTRDRFIPRIIVREPQVRTIGGHTVVFAIGVNVAHPLYSRQRTRQSLVSIDLDTRETRVVDGDTDGAAEWAIDEMGRPVARTNVDLDTQHWTLSVNAPEGWKVRGSGTSMSSFPAIMGMDALGGAVLVADKDPSGNQVFREPLDPNLPRTELAKHVSTALIDGPSRKVLGMGTSEIRFFDPLEQRRWAGIQNAYPGEHVTPIALSGTGKFWIVSVEGLHDGVGFAFVDLDQHKSNWIADMYKGIGAADVSPVTTMSYQAADGLPIRALLVLPAKGPKTGLPLIVLPHARVDDRQQDIFEYDWRAQAFASLGYAVLQPDYRGSEDSETVRQAGYGQLGRKMNTDLSDGVAALAKAGTIDPARVCIVGERDAGYMALVAATVQPGPYRCAVSIAGMSDLSKMLKVMKSATPVRELELKNLIGVQTSDDPLVQALSPAAHADRASIPILLVHAENDASIPFRQSELMKSALEDAGKPVKLVKLENEDHGLSHEATRQQALREIADFLKANNPP